MVTTTGDIVRLNAQCHEILKRVSHGSLGVEETRRGLQQIIEGKLPEAIKLPRWYESPEQQLQNVRNWSRDRNWEFSEGHLPREVPDFAPSSQLDTLVLAIYLPDRDGVPGPIRTLKELWQLIVRRHSAAQDGGLQRDADHLKLWSEAADQYEPGIRWKVVDLGANRGHLDFPPDEESEVDPAGPEVLAAAAHFPLWVQAMDGDDVPFVHLPAYLTRLSVSHHWIQNLCLSYRHSVVKLTSCGASGQELRENYSRPTVRDVS